MAKVTKNTGIQGEWLDKKTLKSGDVAKLMTEAIEIEREYESEKSVQLVAKIKVKGQEGEKNLAINATSKNALIEAFGDETKNWVGKILTIEVEKGVYGGRRGIALYLLPEGYEVCEDERGYVIITKKGDKPKIIVNLEEGEVNPDDIPF